MEFNVPPTKKGMDGYSAFAKFWWDMQSLTPADQAERLKALTVKGWNGMPAIAKLDNLGLSGKGQVRTNNLEDVWKMHQFQASPLSNGSFGLKLTSVSATPRTELLNGSLQLTEAEIKSAVQAMGVSLFAPDLAAAKTGKVLTSANANLTTMHNGAVRPQDEAGEQILDGNSTDNLPNIVSSQFLNAVTSALPTSSNTTPGQEFPVNERIFLGRVAAASCGGCHQSLNDPAIGSPRLNADPSELTFLGKSNFFVHIDETGRPSPALTNMHLPTRFAFLERYMNALESNRICRDLRKTKADFNGDGVTNALDLSILQSVFGTKDPIADIDRSGFVNSIDLSLLKSNFGIINSSSPCPAGEPQKLDLPNL